MIHTGPSTSAMAAVLGLILLSIWLIGVTKRAVFTSLRGVPGPWYAPWTNLVLKAKVMQGQRSQYIHALHQKYGPFVRIAPSEIAISDLASFKKVHKVGSPFTKSPWYQTFNRSPYPGVFAIIDPKAHGIRRRLFAQSFSNTSMLRFESVVRKKIDLAITKIKRDALAGNADILKWFTFMATDVIGELSFGRSFNMLEQEDKTPYIQDLETTMMIGGIRAELGPLVTIAELLPIQRLQHLLRLNDRLDAYGAAAIENHREHIAKAGDAASYTLFSKFVDPGKNQDLPIPVIGAEAGNLIVAGSDTTAVSLTYLVWTLLRPQHRDIKARLLTEISSVPLDAGMAELSSLKYLRAIIDESLRLYGAAPGSLPRIAPPEGAQLGDYFVPGGTTVSVQAYTLHRDGSIFKDPGSFRPERWEDPSPEMKDAFIPFGAGSRVCLGIHLAVMEMMLGVFIFFKTCSSVRLAASTTDASMEFENYFLIAPQSHRCEVTWEAVARPV